METPELTPAELAEVQRFGLDRPEPAAPAAVPAPTEYNEFSAEVAAERQRQIEKGYDEAHDDQKGVDHLLMWAQEYARRGEAVKSAALIEAARESLLRRTLFTPAPTEAECTCYVTDPKYWTTYGSVVEPGSMMEPNPDCPRHFPAPKTRDGEARPEIVVLCGSTRFYDEFQQANFDLTMAGKIVLSVGFYPHAKAKHGHGEGIGHDSVEKVALDELHKRKIDLADRVLVLNVGGYIGESTRSEIDYAVGHGKPVEYLVPVSPEGGEPAKPVFEAMGLPPLATFPTIHPEGSDTE